MPKKNNNCECTAIEFLDENNDPKTTLYIIKDGIAIELNDDEIKTVIKAITPFMDKFSEWIEENDWRFGPVSFNGVIKYRWGIDGEGIQLTTKELYEWFLEQNLNND